MADKIITLRIPDAKVTTALQGFLAIYPNNDTIPDPEWVDPDDGSVAPEVEKYTNNQWVNEKIRSIVVRDIRRGLQKLANQAAQVANDDDLVETA